ncbi:serine hydrolase [Candidatus Sumerlaeota bacterium]|nr:serine hydrolase [Candidatus Sumerlaeota bacterium]
MLPPATRNHAITLRRALVLLVVILIISSGYYMADVLSPSPAERVTGFNNQLFDRVASLERKHHCRIGVSFRDDAIPFEFGYRGNELFHAASTMKVPVMVEVFHQVDEGRVKLDDTVIVDPTCQSMIDNSDFECDAGKYITTRIGQQETVHKLTEQMIIVSDNLATNLLIRMVTPQSVTATMRALGAKDGFVLRGVQDELAYKAGVSNKLTPNDLTTVMTAIADDRAASPESCAAMREILFAQEYNTLIPAQLPAGTRVAHKTGSITGIHHDTAIVYTSTGRYVLTIMTDGIENESESTEVIAELSREIYEGRDKLQPLQ